MRLGLSDREFHALYCPVKNSKSALFLVAFFSVTTFVNWKGLHSAPERDSFVELVFAIIVVAMLAKWLVAFKCFRERLVFGIVIVSLVTGNVESFVPSAFSQHAEMARYGHLALSLLGLLISLTMLVQSARTPKVELDERQASIARQLKRNLLIALAILITMIALAPVLYFLPAPWLQWLARFVSS